MKPVVLVTGAAGGIGRAVCDALADRYTLVGLDRDCADFEHACIEFDLASAGSVERAMTGVRERFGERIAAVIHLAAYFDFTGEDNELYERVNVDGTRHLMRALQSLSVERLVYSGTMLVREPTGPGGTVDESSPIHPTWAYPESKARAEQVIVDERGRIPTVRLHLAGLYDDEKAVPTLSHQIARIYERDMKSELYAGDRDAGQAMVHIEDLLDAVCRAVDRRAALPEDVEILIGEPEPMSYYDLQRRIAALIHGDDDIKTVAVPKPVAKAGAWLEEKSEPVVPDSLDKGEKPFIRPFMIDMADDHYALDIERARELLGWRPRHSLRDGLERLISALKKDPAAWYEKNGITPPDWLHGDDAEAVRRTYEAQFAKDFERTRWTSIAAALAGAWLAASPTVIDYGSTASAWTHALAGAFAAALALTTLLRSLSLLRWAVACVGAAIALLPILFNTPSATVYLNGTVVGGLILALAVIPPPHPGISPRAAAGSAVSPGKSRSPSSWGPRVAIMALAFIAFLLARYMAAYQLGHVEGLWDPFFGTGSERVTGSDLSESFPISDAGFGAYGYLLETVLALAGSRARWRTMPWLVTLFAFLVIPMGVVSVAFIAIQPVLIGAWCGLCILAAIATLIMIPLALPEMVATWGHVRSRLRAGRPFLPVFLSGD
ncbi:MAG: NAD-dependent epimerase/dehydratase family protein [Gammaproteobacteria bacterium]